jgi:hypothetical protein
MDIETNNFPGTDLHRVFIWDNLTAHHSAYVHNTVTGCVSPTNFSIVPWPLYHQKYSLIEYKICEVMKKIGLKKEDNWDFNRLEHKITLAANQIKSVEELFIPLRVQLELGCSSNDYLSNNYEMTSV